MLNIESAIHFITVFAGSNKYCFWCKKVSTEALRITTTQYILLVAAVIKCIAPPTFNHIMYKISVFVLAPAKIKRIWATPLYFCSLLEPV